MTNQSTGYALSAQQEQRWKAAIGSPAGRVSLCADIAPARDGDVSAAFAAAIDRHAILRSAIVKSAGGRQPLQTVNGVSDSAGIEILSQTKAGVRVRLTADSLYADIETLRLLIAEVAVGIRKPEGAGAAAFEYLKVSEWQYDLLDSAEAEDSLAWWRARLDDIHVEAKSAPSQRMPAAKCIRFVCPAELNDAGANLSDVLLACWLLTCGCFRSAAKQTILYRVNGRFAPELRDVAGPLSRYLPLSFEPLANQTLQDFIASVHSAVEQAADRQEYYYPAAIGRDDPLVRGGMPAYSFTERQAHLNSDGVEVSIVEEHEPIPTRRSYGLQCVQDEDGVSVSLHYDDTELSDLAAAFMQDVFLNYVGAYASDPRQVVGRIRPLSATKAREALQYAATSEEDIDERPFSDVPSRILDNIRQAAGQTAVISGERSISYGELGEHAARLATTLRHLGIGAERPVGVAIHASLEAIVAIVAVMQTGGVYVPLAPDDPPERMGALIRALGIGVVLCAEEPERFAEAEIRVVRVDLDEPGPRAGDFECTPLVPVNGAYMIHTSGSTGEARAVLVSHRALLASTEARRSHYMAPVQRMLLVPRLTFDSSIASLFWTLVDGGTLVIPQQIPSNAEELRTLISRHSVTHVLCIPRLLQAITDGAQPGELASLRTAIVAGEACSEDVVHAFLDGAPCCALYNEYGVSEAGVWSTVYELKRGDIETSVPIGHAISGARLYTCNSRLELLPVGAVGELCIAGPLLARCYAGRPGATAERFVPDPFASSPGSRLYRTGDRVQSSDGGTFRFVGRTDNQVKLRGQRIELEQLEAIVRQNLPVAEVAVVVDRRTASPGLAVFYTSQVGVDVTPEQVRTVLAARLPIGVAPEQIFRTTSLPRTATGKLDRRQLEESIQTASGRAAGSPPKTPLERTLAGIWGPLLGVPEVSRDDDFLALGGDSIISLQVTARARSAGLTITPRQVMACRTIAALAAELEKTPAGGTALASESTTLTPIQRWFFAQKFVEPQHYDQAVLMDAGSDLDLDVLQRALQTAVGAHAALRTGFMHDGDSWRAFYEPKPQAVEVRVVDGAAVQPRDDERVIGEALMSGYGTFELAQPPLLRMLAVKGAGGRPRRVLLVAHHLIVDGVSWRILLEDVAVAYRAILLGEQPAPPPEPASPGNWADRLSELAGQGPVREEASYWTDNQSDSEWSLPLDYADGRNTEAEAATATFALEPEQTLYLVRAREDLFLDSSLLGALMRALTEWRGHDALWIAVERHGRDVAGADLDVSRTIGWLTAVAPVRLQCDLSLEMSDLVTTIGRQLRQAPSDSWLFDYLRHSETGEDSRRLMSLPAAPVSFNNLGLVHSTALPHLPLTLGMRTFGPLRSLSATRPHLIDVTASTVDNALTIVITYSSALHARRTIEHIGERMLSALKEICAVKA